MTPSSGTAQTVTVDNVANATSATKATQDGEGNVIITTYATKSEIKNVAYTNMLNDFIENQIFENGVTLQYGTGYIYWLDSTSTAGSYAYSLYQNQFRTYTGSTVKILTFPNKTGTVATLDDISRLYC